jgi:dTDP-L-rhamnose 4-epimerase
LDGVDAVYHLAAETAVGQSQYEIGRYVSVNVQGTAEVLEACVAAGVGRLVLASSRAVYGEGRHRCTRCALAFQAAPRSIGQLDAGVWAILCPTCGSAAEPLAMAEDDPTKPTSVYGLTKQHQEQLAMAVAAAHGLHVTLLRPFNVFGPGQALGNPYTGVLGTFYHQARRGEDIELYEDGEMLRDFVFVDDVVEVLAGCLVSLPRASPIVNVGTGRAMTLRAVAQAICRTLGVKPRISCHGRFRVGDVRHAFSDPSLAEEQLAFTPRTSFEVGLEAYMGWALAQTQDRDEGRAAAELLARGLLRRSHR